MKEADQPTKYCLYARKSSEQDERQAMSIEQQLTEMVAHAEKVGITIADIRRESHSSKESGTRPVFNQMILDIRAGMFDAILTWATDRLSRNAGDLGSLVDLMDQGKLLEIHTHAQTFHNSPNEKFLLMILGSQAKLENDNRGVNVKRGLKNKAVNGWRPGVAPIGYKNTGWKDRKISIDTKRAPVIKELFEKSAYEGCTGRQLSEWLNNEVDFRSRNNKHISISMIQKVLKSSFYTGKFEYPVGSGIWCKGKHKPIITQEVFDLVTERLAAFAPRKPYSKVFNFTRMIKCGSCGSGIVAQEKIKYQLNGNIHRYVYYNCGQSKDFDCKEPYIREEDLLSQFVAMLDKVSLDPLRVQEKYQRELAKFLLFAQSHSANKDTIVDIKEYAKHVLLNGTREDKRELIGLVTTELFLKNRAIHCTN